MPKITQFEQREKQNGLKCMKIKEIWDRERNIVANIIKIHNKYFLFDTISYDRLLFSFKRS